VAEITASMVKQLREMTGAGMMDCKDALKEAEGNIDKAVEVLRKKGLKNLGKRSSNVAAEGTVGVYLHSGDQVAAIVELNCETDFVARGDVFREAARGFAMHVAAMKPEFLTQEQVPVEMVKKEEEIAIEQLNDNQKANADKIIPGKIKKFFESIVLLDQPFIKDDSKTVRDILQDLSMKVGEKVEIRKFYRLEVGEDIQTENKSNLTDDVAALVKL
jgi:elongation factor Ts